VSLGAFEGERASVATAAELELRVREQVLVEAVQAVAHRVDEKLAVLLPLEQVGVLEGAVDGCFQRKVVALVTLDVLEVKDKLGLGGMIASGHNLPLVDYQRWLIM